MPRVRFSLAIAAAALAASLAYAAPGRADSTPVGPLPPSPVTTVTTRPGLLVAAALPRQSPSSGLVWRIARRYNSTVVRQVAEADVGATVVVVFRVVGRGTTTLAFALTRGDTSPKALKAARYTIKSV